MNITYIIGLFCAFVVMLLGMILGSEGLVISDLFLFIDGASILITVGCTIAVVIASFPKKMLMSIPKHFAIILNEKKHDPISYIDQLSELAQIARKNGLLALEEKGNEQTDPFFKQAIMLIVDANDPDKVRNILSEDIEWMSARHDAVIGMYDRGASVAPAFGMVGTLIGLIKMLYSMSEDSGTLGPSMAVALITTLYGCILAHMIFTPIATNLRNRDDQEVLCKTIIMEGIASIQSGENPKLIRERLLTLIDQKNRNMAIDEENSKKKGKKNNKKK